MSKLVGYYYNEKIYDDDPRLPELVTKTELLLASVAGKLLICRCDYCGNLLEPEVLKCPYCGGLQ